MIGEVKFRRMHATAALCALGAVVALNSVATALGQHPASGSAAEDARLAAFFEKVFERRVEESPIFQSQLGRRTGALGKWDDFSDAHSEAQNKRTRQDLAHLRSEFDYDKLSDDSKLSYDLFVFDAERRLANFEFRYHHYIATQHISQVAGLPTVLQNLHPIRTTKDAEAYISRLRSLGAVMEQFATLLRTRAAEGVIAKSESDSQAISKRSSSSSGGIPATILPTATRGATSS